MKFLLLTAVMAVSGVAAQASTVDPGTSISLASLNDWGSGYNAGYKLDFSGLLGALDTLTGWSLTATVAAPVTFSTGWVNGGDNATSCNANQATSFSGYGSSSFTISSACAATAGKTFAFFLQGQGKYSLPMFSLTGTGLPASTQPTPDPIPVAQTPLPAAAWLLIAALGGLFGLSRRRRATA